MIGKITSESQDLVYVNVRTEDDTYTETVSGGTESTMNIIGTFGQDFSVSKWFSRIKIVISEGNGNNVILRLCDSHSKSQIHLETIVQNVGTDQVIHFMFDPMPAGDYYWEVDSMGETITPYIINGSSYGGAYVNDSLLSSDTFKSKIMHCTDLPQLKAVAIDGDEVDNGAATLDSGTSLGAINTGTVIENINKKGDTFGSGGKILTGSWFLKM